MKKNRRMRMAHMAPEMRHYRPAEWMWFVGGDETQAYSPKHRGYVSVTSDEFLVWEGRHGEPTRIKSEAELWDVLDRVRIPH